MPFSSKALAATARARMLCTALLLSVVATSAGAQLKATDLHGKPIDLGQAAPGEVNVLIFVRTDCPLSGRYAPTLQKLAEDHAEAARFWLVYPDRAESAAVIQKYLKDYNYKRIAAVRDPGHALVKMAHARITPEAAVFDTKAHLVYHGRIDNWYVDVGHARSQPTTHELRDAIQASVAGKSVAVSETKAVGCYISDVQ